MHFVEDRLDEDCEGEDFNAEDETPFEDEDIGRVVNDLVQKFEVAKYLSGSVTAQVTTPRLLRVGEGYPVLDFTLNFQLARGPEVTKVRAFYAALAEQEIVAEITDIRNLQPQEFRFSFKKLLARVPLPEP